MKKILNISLYVIIFLLVAVINVISIKKYFDNKRIERLDNIIAYNYITSLISYNKIEEPKTEVINLEVVSEVDEVEEVVEKEVIEEINLTATETEKKETIIEEDFEESEENNSEETNIIFDGLTEEQLVLKLEKSLKNELSGTGVNFVSYYKSTGLDPYLATAIVLHETGCTWNCSKLVKQCYNYGGMKGGENKYNNTNYTCYSSKEEGINAYLNMLYNNYYSKGLITPELINPKYAASLEWAVKINNYIEKIKNN